jgi:hypothetical protein
MGPEVAMNGQGRWVGAAAVALAIAAVAVSGAGCARRCEGMDPLEEWEEHPDVVPADGLVCTTRDDGDTAMVHFVTRDDPWIEIVDKLEGDDWVRIDQDLNEDLSSTTTFAKGSERIEVYLFRDPGFPTFGGLLSTLWVADFKVSSAGRAAR